MPLPAGDGARRTRALIVDRDECTLVLATEALTSFGAGFDVATARSAEEARAWVQTFEPELVLLDEAFADLAADFDRSRPNSKLKLILVTSAHADAPPVPGFFEVLPKPVTLSSLLGVARRLHFY